MNAKVARFLNKVGASTKERKEFLGLPADIKGRMRRHWLDMELMARMPYRHHRKAVLGEK